MRMRWLSSGGRYEAVHIDARDDLSAHSGADRGSDDSHHARPLSRRPPGILIVTAGTGRVQQWGGPIEDIQSGDVVRIPAGQKHWHGAAPQASMAHIALTEPRDGTSVQWMEKVSDEQYNGGPPSPEGHAQERAQPQVQSDQQPQPSSRQAVTTGASGAQQQKIAPGLATLTDEVLFGDVWRRPELSPRDRSLVTISVLIATGLVTIAALGRDG
jgi:4-carboxymuconolactone decarboxylase